MQPIIKDRVVRVYEVVIWPDETPDGPYDPFTITLGYAADAVPDDAYGDDVKADALRVAVKAEVKAGRLDAVHDTTFTLENLRMKRQLFYPADKTLEAQRGHNAREATGPFGRKIPA